MRSPTAIEQMLSGGPVHETGHTVVARIVGMPVEAVSLFGGDGLTGVTHVLWKTEIADLDVNVGMIAVALGGVAAEQRFADLRGFRLDERTASADIRRAREIARGLPGNRLETWCTIEREVARTLAEPRTWTTIQRMALRLLRDRELSAGAVDAIMADRRPLFWTLDDEISERENENLLALVASY